MVINDKNKNYEDGQDLEKNINYPFITNTTTMQS